MYEGISKRFPALTGQIHVGTRKHTSLACIQQKVNALVANMEMWVTSQKVHIPREMWAINGPLKCHIWH